MLLSHQFQTRRFAITSASHRIMRAVTIGGLGMGLSFGLMMPAQAQITQTQSSANNSTAAQNQTPIPKGDENHREPDFVFTEAPTDHVLGAEDAPHTIIAYASVTCGHCGNWFTKDWPVVKKDLVESGKIRFVFREFPTQPVQLAMAGFYIANCAKAAQSGDDDEAKTRQNEAFFEAIEYQMENQAATFEAAKAGKAQETFSEMGKKFGMKDLDALNACFSDESHYSTIDASVSRAQAGDVTGTPFFIINGEAYKGAHSGKDFVEVIEKLEKAGVSTFDKNPFISTPKLKNIKKH